MITVLLYEAKSMNWSIKSTDGQLLEPTLQ
jgi:hypothetical protein